MFTVASITVVVGIAAAVLLLLLFWFMYRYSAVGISIVVILLVCEAIWVILPGVKIGLYVYPTDIIFVMMAIVATIKYLTRRVFSEIPKSLLVFAGLLLLSFAIGLPKNGTYSGVDFREYFFVLSGVGYVTSFPATNRSVATLVNIWLIGAFLICLIAVYRWSMMAAGLESYAWLDATGIEGRVITSTAAFSIAGGIVMLLFALRHRDVGGRGWLWLLPILVIVVIGVQQRTVWVVAAAGIFLTILRAREGRGQLIATLGLVVALMGGVAVPLVTGGPLEHVGSTIKGTAEAGASTNSGTFVGRIVGWKELLKEYAGYNPVYQIIGKPFGSGYVRMQGNQEVGYNPHNYYIQTLLRVGVVGLGALLVLYFVVMRRLGTLQAANLSVQGDMFWVLLAMQLIFNITYNLTFSQGLIFGMAVALAMQYGRSANIQNAESTHATIGRPAHLS